MSRVHSHSVPLRQMLVIDAIVSGLTGLLLIIAASPLGGIFSLPEPLLRYSGAILVPFALFVLVVARSDPFRRTGATAIVALNAGWVVASVLALIAPELRGSALGIAFIITQAAAVAALAALQLRALSRLQPEPRRSPL